jgi:hypothetical protein
LNTVTVQHPAKFSEHVVSSLARLVRAEQLRVGQPLRVLDPFAGVGRVHRLARPGRVETVGVEIESEWAACHPDTLCADAIDWMRAEAARLASRFDVICTSPCYGNRLSDSHDARDGSVRRSYTHDLGRPVTEGSSGAMPFGPAYWAFHAEAYRLFRRVLRPGGLVLLNVSDFVRDSELVPAVAWHRGALYGAGFREDGRPVLVATQRLRFGANHAARAEHEVIVRARVT